MTRLLRALAIVLCVVRWSGAETVEDRIDRRLDGINRASEAGDISRTQLLRSELASYCASIGDFPCAVRQYDLLLALRPRRKERVRLFVRLGETKDALHDFEGAIDAFQDALHDDSDFYDANLDLAREYAKVDLNTRAIKSFQRCIALNPRDPRPLAEIAATYAAVGYVNKAIEAYQKAIAIRPQPDFYLGLADCYVHEGDIAGATDVLVKAKSVVPLAELDVRLGDIYHKEGDLRQASASWEEALKAAPQRDDVRLKLAMVYDRLNRRSETDLMLKKLLSDYPRSPLVHFLTAWVLLNRGDRQGSRREASVVQTLSPTDMVQHFNDELLAQIKK